MQRKPLRSVSTFVRKVYRRVTSITRGGSITRKVHPEPAKELWTTPQPRRVLTAGNLFVYDEISSARVDWRVTEMVVKWIMAGRDILDENEDMFPSDVLDWKLRVTGMLLFGAFQALMCLIAMVFWASQEGHAIAYLVSAYEATLIVLFLVLWISNRFRLVRQNTGVVACTSALVLMCLLAPSSIHYLGGWHWSAGTLIWNLGAPVAGLVLLPHPLKALILLASLRAAVDIAVFCTASVSSSSSSSLPASSFLQIILPLLGNTICPLAIAVSFRRACQETVWRGQALKESHEGLKGQQTATRWLIFSMVPPKRARRLPCASPQLWHTGPVDYYSDCSLVQMDVSGFTVLSSQIGSEELVDLINALFTSIDFAAECIGKIWKIELIGDCYKAVIGGPSPCEDHAYRATVFAYTIVEIVTRIADRLHVPLKVRVGVHSGAATAAVVGQQMPRYLFFGRDCEIVNRLEMNADTGGVLLSAAAAARLGHGWEHARATKVVLADGSEVGACAIVSSVVNQKQMLRARHRFARLGDFHRHYCRSRYRLNPDHVHSALGHDGAHGTPPDTVGKTGDRKSVV